jgi:ribose-phosphate pyrophosphokinase
MESPTATEVALPGLEARVVTDPSPQHYIERGPLKRLMVFAGRSHPDLAQEIAEKLGVELGDVELETFSNGETYCRYVESIRGADVFIVQTGVGDVDSYLMELVFMIQAAKLASAKRITAVVPLFPYARQDRKAKPREPISARLVADMIQLAGADRVLTMDLHAGQIQGFFTIPVDHMTAQPLFARHFRDLGLTGPGVVSVAPDEGRAKVAVRFANMIEADFAIMHKTRPARDQAEITEVTGKVRDGVFCGGALAKFEDAPIEGMVVTDTVPINRLEAPPNLTVLPVAGLLAETIMNVFADDSVSAIFGGENQLF